MFVRGKNNAIFSLPLLLEIKRYTSNKSKKLHGTFMFSKILFYHSDEILSIDYV